MALRLQPERVTIQHLKWPVAAPPLRIIQVTDLHLSREPGRLEDAVAEWIDQTPHDAIVFTGDAVNEAGAWERAGAWLASLSKAPMKFAVPGNWLYRTRGTRDDFCSWSRHIGFTPLVNQGVRMPWKNGSIYWSGVDDYRHGDPHVEQALKSRQADDFVILLSHNPDILYCMNKEDVQLLVCGHTHGGQIRVPYFGAVRTSTRLGRKYAAGLFQLAPETYMYISRGLGTGKIKCRWNCPSEVTSIEIYSKVEL